MKKYILRFGLTLFAILYLFTHFLPRAHAVEVIQPETSPIVEITCTLEN